MVAEGILLERKEWLITRCEKMYFDNLEKMVFWDIIVISIAVSLWGA